MEHVIIDKKWEDLVKMIEPLDLVLFSGNDLVSSTIRRLQNKKLDVGNFSHVGVIVSSDILPNIKELQVGEWYVWESTSSLRLPGFENEVPDIFGKHKLGVQIRNLKKVIDIYNGNIYIGKLKNNPLNRRSRRESICKITTQDIFSSSNPIPVSPYENKYHRSQIDNTNTKTLSFDSLNEIDILIKEIDALYESIFRNNDVDVSDGTFLSNHVERVEENTPSEIYTPPIRNESLKDSEFVNNVSILKRSGENGIQTLIEIQNRKNTTKEYKRIIKEIRYIYEIYGDRLYNSSILDLLSSLYPILRPFRNLKYKIVGKLAKLFKSKKIERNAVFCSQFVAIIYSRLGLIDKDIDHKNFVPVDFLGCDEDGQTNIISEIFRIIK